MKQDTKNISRIEILNYITQFCVVKCFGDNSYSLGQKEFSFHGTHFEKQVPPVGSLCLLQGAPFTKFYLGWLKEIKDADNRFSMQYLLESIEDGQLCWWSNVGIWYLPLETTNKHPDWRWTDKQWELKKRWFNCCYKKRNAYTIRPVFPVFNEDGSVILKLRKMFNEDAFIEKKFDNWKAIRIKDLLEFYDQSLNNSTL